MTGKELHEMHNSAYYNAVGITALAWDQKTDAMRNLWEVLAIEIEEKYSVLPLPTLTPAPITSHELFDIANNIRMDIGLHGELWSYQTAQSQEYYKRLSSAIMGRCSIEIGSTEKELWQHFYAEDPGFSIDYVRFLALDKKFPPEKILSYISNLSIDKLEEIIEYYTIDTF